jgi:BNR/Asp-box repeat
VRGTVPFGVSGKGFFPARPIKKTVSAGWTARVSPTAGVPLTGIATNGLGVLVATDQNLNVYRCTDGGITWTLVTTLATGTPGDFGNLNFSNGVFVIGGGNLGQVFRSTDQGLTWSALIATGLGHPVAALAGDGIGNWLATSLSNGEVSVSADNGATWTAHATAALSYAPISAVWDGARWVTTGLHGGSALSCVITSPDGFTVTQTNLVPSGEFFNNTLGLAGGIYVVPTSHLAVRRSATTAAALSTNADTAVPLTGGGGISAVCPGAGRWFCFDFNGGVADSTDAISWHTATQPLNFLAGDFCYQCVYDVAHAVFVAIGGTSGSISTHT